MSLPVYPHLGLDDAELARVCEELFNSDSTIVAHREKIQAYQTKIEEYIRREEEHRVEVAKIESRLVDVRAELRHLETQKGEQAGRATQMVFHQRIAKQRVKEIERMVEKRKKYVYFDEVNRRLKQLGRELKLGRGKPAKVGPPAPPTANENQETQ